MTNHLPILYNDGTLFHLLRHFSIVNENAIQCLIDRLHAIVSKLPTTNLLTLVLKEQQSSNFLITAFPGPTVLPLPSTKFSAEFNETCKLFWEQHVFLSLI